MSGSAPDDAPQDAPLPVAAAVLLHAGRVLVQTRPAGAHYAGFWEFPGGKLEPGESPAAGAERECREELGLEVRARETLCEVEWSYPGRRVRVHFVRCEADGVPAPEALDGQLLRWADADDLGTLRFLPANAEVLELLAARLTAGD